MGEDFFRPYSGKDAAKDLAYYSTDVFHLESMSRKIFSRHYMDDIVIRTGLSDVQ